MNPSTILEPPTTQDRTVEAKGPPSPSALPPLFAGDRLTRHEFHRRYEAMPKRQKAELVEGVVYMPSPLRIDYHARPHADMITWLGVYRSATPGVFAADNGTLFLDLDNDVQPDVTLCIDAAAGGHSRIRPDGYAEGAPELIAEIAASSASYDLHDKLRAYRRNGVQEYLVWRVLDGAIDWWELVEGAYVPLPADEHGVVDSRVFPGLRLDVAAMLAGDLARALAVQQAALGGAAHAAFVEKLGVE
jgi:Uma2 family endonuclease